MSIRSLGQFLCAVIWIAALPFALVAMPDDSGFRTLLEKHAGMDHESLSRVRAGHVVARLLESRSDSEVACVGIATVGVPNQYFLSQYRDIGKFKKGPAILQLGTLGMPPSVSDLRNLTLSHADIEAIKECRPGDCKVKLSASMLEQIRKSMDGAPATIELGNSAFRTALIDYVTRYLAAGNPELICYTDKMPRVCLAEELRGLLGEFSVLREQAPMFYEHLAGSRQVPLEGVENFLYWSEEKLGPLKPILSVTHVMIYSMEREGARWSFIAAKQIYASHYSRASLSLTVLVQRNGQNDLWMLYVNRSRVDGLGGWLGAAKRAIVRRRLRNGMLENIGRIRTKLERSYRYQDRPR
jgi:hypothetical protein